MEHSCTCLWIWDLGAANVGHSWVERFRAKGVHLLRTVLQGTCTSRWLQITKKRPITWRLVKDWTAALYISHYRWPTTPHKVLQLKLSTLSFTTFNRNGNVNVPASRKRQARETHDGLQRGRKLDVAKKPSRVSTRRRVPQNLADISSQHQSKRKRNEPVLPRSQDQRNFQKSSRRTQGGKLNSSGTTRKQKEQSRHLEATRSKRRVGADPHRLIVQSDKESRNSKQLRESGKRIRRRVQKDKPSIPLFLEDKETKNSKSERTIMTSQKSLRTTWRNNSLLKQTKVKFAKHVEIWYIYIYTKWWVCSSAFRIGLSFYPINNQWV